MLPVSEKGTFHSPPPGRPITVVDSKHELFPKSDFGYTLEKAIGNQPHTVIYRKTSTPKPLPQAFFDIAVLAQRLPVFDKIDE